MDRGKAKIIEDVRLGLSTGGSISKESISPPFSWLTNRRAVVHSTDYLLSNGISAICGDVECKKCKYKDILVYDLQQKFKEVSDFIAEHLEDMDVKGSKKWMRPPLPSCPRCHKPDCLSPVIPSRKRDINWLFLFLGRMLGSCSHEQLKYFCKHNKVYPHEKGDRVLLFVYIGICLQLDTGSLF